jgi:tripartite-type tricarboxylate transporter receptor subunit TctC
LFKLAAGVNIVHVPYKGAAPAMTALMAGEVDMMFNGLSSALPHVKSGKLRALALGGDKRSALFPELPTVRESGFDFNTTGWYGVVAPRGTPQSVVNTLHKGLVRALATPQLKAQFTRLVVEGVGSSPQEFSRLIAEELQKWARVIKATGLTMKP